ncbi:MAG: ubiquinol-cytochrome c reductase iron-sulfur subunit [Bacteroidales bacterium]|nr:ubiquinol-cytochrome c reductase iron-sulfur subunit [Bacteroidales bacterium]
MNRRQLIKNIAAGTATVFIVPSLLSSCQKEELGPENGNTDPSDNTLTIDLNNSNFSSLVPEGGSMVVNNIMLINTGSGYIALSSVCTHQGCQVSYNHSNQNLPCPCHESIFSTTGTVLNGPASSPLRKFDVMPDGDILTVDLS